jgi:hypothetical protein
MNEWVQARNLTEVLHQGRPPPTWKPNEGPKKAPWLLDRVVVTPEAHLSTELSVQWHSPLIIFDHAVLLLRVQHSLMEPGWSEYVGACRPDREAFLRSRCRVNHRKWLRHVSEWSQMVSMGLRQF